MVAVSSLYSNPAVGVCEVSALVFNVFFENFKTFGALALCQALAYIPVFLVFGILFLALFEAEIETLSTGLGDTGVRRLDEAVGGSQYNSNNNGNGLGFSSHNSATVSYDYSTTEMTTLPANFFAVIWAMIGVCVAFLVTSVCISAAFQGAFVRAAGEVFAGRSPHWKACLHIGWEKMCSTISFGLVYLLTLAVIALVWFSVTILPTINKETGMPNVGLAALSIVAFVCFYIYFTCSMTGALTAVVVEGRAVVASMKRSFRLCKSNICFIFCSSFVFHLLETIGWVVIKSSLQIFFIGSNAAAVAAITGLTSLIVSLLMGPLNAILNPVLYFSLRIQNEGLTAEELQNELELTTTNMCIESQTGQGHGIYQEVGSQDDGGAPIVAGV